MPEIGADEVLVRVEAAALNPLDVKLQSGALRGMMPLSFPYALGTDLAGTVERAGPLAGRWHEGAKVVTRLDPAKGGAMAEFAVVPVVQLAAAPATISMQEAAGVPTTGGTAWQALFQTARVARGQTVLVHAGAGGVGSFAVQLARLAGARVIATASGDGIGVAQRLGANQVIDYRSARFWEQVSDVDVVLDTIGGETQQRSFEVLRHGGTLVSTTSTPDEALAKAHGVTATFIFVQPEGGRLGAVLDLVGAGKLKVLMDRKVALADFADAFQYQASGRARGKIVVSLG